MLIQGAPSPDSGSGVGGWGLKHLSGVPDTFRLRTPPSGFPARRQLPTLPPACGHHPCAHLIFTCLIKHLLPVTLLASPAPKLKKSRPVEQAHKSPGFGRSTTVSLSPLAGRQRPALPGLNHTLPCMDSAWLGTPQVSQEPGDRGASTKP